MFWSTSHGIGFSRTKRIEVDYDHLDSGEEKFSISFFRDDGKVVVHLTKGEFESVVEQGKGVLMDAELDRIDGGRNWTA